MPERWLRVHALPERRLRVCALYADPMTYMPTVATCWRERRCRWGIGFSLTTNGLGERLCGNAADIYYIGGGQDRDQKLCADGRSRSQGVRWGKVIGTYLYGRCCPRAPGSPTG